MMPLISIIMPVYNAEEYIEEAIKSVLNQTYSNWELILVDDCSTDNSCNVIQKYLLDIRIKFFRNKINSGPALTRNLALDNASGEYITFLDSDDFWEKDKLLNQINFMIEHKLSMSHGNYHFCNVNRKVIKSVKTDRKISYNDLLKGNQFKIMTVMLKRDLINSLCFENIKHEDYMFFLKCLNRTNFSLCDLSKIDSYCRIGKLSVSSNKMRSAFWTWSIYYKHLKLGLVKSVYYFAFYAINGFLKYR
ncbi:glycosyltransferase family 2 protein [Actinobacillus suis]|uniref:Glycosyltransferase family 2 protein n=3 Tax=Actinobacillus suis TaxID=716 RepID=A0ABT1WV34_ACTSU|nr:glycosyltransferase family A protein [Actinobacillus suis]AFU20240.1 Putative lipooligosaccharide biosynthesis protein [Actinobacillus suis H91-0380]MCQ9630288.1 glycosyltransferase family 2 protein [Actinobacillus suis]MCQ9712168.1 glycosyltransferase family 2 protein [Actinobacillus suis]